MATTVYFSFDNPSGVRNKLGQFEAAYNKLQPFYRLLAEELRNEAADIIATERDVRDKNPRRGEKGTLAAVTRSSGNSDNTNNGFVVGIHSFLARTEAKYYRIIEEGSEVAAPRYAETMISGGWKPPGEEYYGTAYFIPARAERRVEGLPRRDIKPLFAYERAWGNLNASGRVRAIWRKLLVDAGYASSRGPLPQKYQFPPTGNVNY